MTILKRRQHNHDDTHLTIFSNLPGGTNSGHIQYSSRRLCVQHGSNTAHPQTRAYYEDKHATFIFRFIGISNKRVFNHAVLTS